MTGAVAALLGAAGVAAVTDWAAVATRRKPLEYVAKPAVLALLVLAALALEPEDPTQRTAFVIALGASLVGDVALMRDHFEPGLGAFLVAHLAYVTGLSVEVVSWPGAAVAGALVLVALLVVGRRIVVAVSDTTLRRAVVLYTAALAAVVVLAAATLDPWAIAAAVVFAVSDGLLGWDRFARPVPAGSVGSGGGAALDRAGWDVAVHATYHLAQAGFVVSLLA